MGCNLNPRALKTTNSPARADENRASKKRLKPLNQAGASPKQRPIPPRKAKLACERVRSNATHPRALKTSNSPARADEKRASKKRPKPLNQAGASPKSRLIPSGKANVACERIRSNATNSRALKTSNSPTRAEEKRASKKRPKPLNQAGASPKS
jgi:hypothetical protein